MKKFISLVVVLTLCLGLCTPAFAAEDIPEGYTPIYNIFDLYNIRNNLEGKYILMSDIYLLNFISYGDSPFDGWNPDNTWIPIGTENQPFKGILDGNNKRILELSTSTVVNSNIRDATGLFAFTVGATIKDLTVVDAKLSIKSDVDDFYSVGVIAGFSKYTEFENCKVSGTIDVDVNGTCAVGGIVGEIAYGDSKITNCYNEADITVSAKNELYAGGIVGQTIADVSVCANEGNITIDSFLSDKEFVDYLAIGGICGVATSTISNCYNKGNFECNEQAASPRIGGIGGNTCSVSECYSTGEISVSNNSDAVRIGGISGYVAYHSNGWGIEESQDFYITNCYCLDNVSAILGNTNDEQNINVAMLTEQEMKTQESFVGFDFNNIWMIEDGNYPTFRTNSVIPPLDNDEIPVLVDAEIVYVPLKNRIVFSFGSPNTPKGIVLKLIYSDGTCEKATIVETDDGCFANKHQVFGGVRAAVVEFGLLETYLYLNDGEIQMSYKYFVIPPIFSIIRILFERTIWI